MAWEPWAMGTAVESASIQQVLGSIGPIPARVRVLHLSYQPEVSVAMTLSLSVSVGEAPARVLADMRGQRQLFPIGLTAFGGGPPIIFTRVFAGVPSERRWYWDLELQGGPFYVNVLVDQPDAGQIMCAFGLVGLRQVE